MIRLRRRPMPAVEATVPLINVAFLLMAFFMLIGRMDATAPFAVVPPESDLGATLPQGGATVSISSTGELALDGAAASRAEIVKALAERVAAGEPGFVRINAHADAPLGDLLPLVGALEERGVPRIALVVTPAAPRGP